MNYIERKLKRPFEERLISWRVGATNLNKDRTLKWGNKPLGKPLAYVDARDVMRRLDEVFPMSWQAKYSHADQKTICEIGVKIDGEWIWRAGGAGDTDIEAEKGAISDAFKRAAVLFGIGQYLYKIENDFVEIDPKKGKILLVPKLPKWATPTGWDDYIDKMEEIDDLISQVKVYLQNKDVADAVHLFGTLQNEDVEIKTAAWFKLASYERRAIKDYQEANKK